MKHKRKGRQISEPRHHKYSKLEFDLGVKWFCSCIQYNILRKGSRLFNFCIYNLDNRGRNKKGRAFLTVPKPKSKVLFSSSLLFLCFKKIWKLISQHLYFLLNMICLITNRNTGYPPKDKQFLPHITHFHWFLLCPPFVPYITWYFPILPLSFLLPSLFLNDFN